MQLQPYVVTEVASPLTVGGVAAPVTTAVPAALVATAQPGDACALSPALRSWIEYLVDAHIDKFLRHFREEQSAQVASALREGAAASHSSVVAVAQQAHGVTQQGLHMEQASRLRLEAEVRSLADAHARMLAVVESLSGDQERQQTTGSKTRAATLAGVEQVMSTMDELHRSVERDNSRMTSILKQHEGLLAELRRSHAEDAARNRAAISDLQRSQADSGARQRVCSEELSSACSSIADTRQQVGDLAQLVQRLDGKLASFRAEVIADVTEEIRTVTSTRESIAENERLQYQTLQREVTAANATRAELESRMETIRAEVQALGGSRSDIDARLRDGQQAVTRRMDSLQASVQKDSLKTREEFNELVYMVQQLEHRLTNLNSDVSKEVQCAGVQRDIATRDYSIGLDSLRSEVASTRQQLGVIEDRLEGTRMELATVAASREAFEFKVHDNQDDLRKALEACQAAIQDDCSSSQQRRITAELRAEVRALAKSEQAAIAALDEQLWVTDNRLGRRIDELAQVAGCTAAGSRTPSMATSPQATLGTLGKRMTQRDLETKVANYSSSGECWSFIDSVARGKSPRSNSGAVSAASAAQRHNRSGSVLGASTATDDSSGVGGALAMARGAAEAFADRAASNSPSQSSPRVARVAMSPQRATSSQRVALSPSPLRGVASARGRSGERSKVISDAEQLDLLRLERRHAIGAISGTTSFRGDEL